MPVYSLAPGNTGISIDAAITAVTGAVFFINKVDHDGQISWTYEPGTTPPTAISLALQISPDNVNWKTVDSFSNPSVADIRQIAGGRGMFVRVKVLSLTIGSGTAFTSRIIV